jgi:hypothetical protein
LGDGTQRRPSTNHCPGQRENYRDLGPVKEQVGESFVVQASRLPEKMQAGRLHHNCELHRLLFYRPLPHHPQDVLLVVHAENHLAAGLSSMRTGICADWTSSEAGLCCPAANKENNSLGQVVTRETVSVAHQIRTTTST